MSDARPSVTSFRLAAAMTPPTARGRLGRGARGASHGGPAPQAAVKHRRTAAAAAVSRPTGRTQGRRPTAGAPPAAQTVTISAADNCGGVQAVVTGAKPGRRPVRHDGAGQKPAWGFPFRLSVRTNSFGGPHLPPSPPSHIRPDPDTRRRPDNRIRRADRQVFVDGRPVRYNFACSTGGATVWPTVNCGAAAGSTTRTTRA